MNCQPWRQGNCSYKNWIAVITHTHTHSYCNLWNNFAVRMGQERLHVKKRRDGRHAEKERVLHTLPLNVPSLTMPLVLPIWRENKGQRSTPLFRLLVWLPCTHFIRPFQCPTHCKRHGEICFRALTPCSPPLNPPLPSTEASGDMRVI